MRGLLKLTLILAVVSAVPAFARPNDQDKTTTSNTVQRHWGTTNTSATNPRRQWPTRQAPQTQQPQWHHQPAPVNTSTVQPGSTPPGWAHGRKVGWHGDDRPPGWERRHHHRRHWEREHDREWRRHHEERERWEHHHRDHDRH